MIKSDFDEKYYNKKLFRKVFVPSLIEIYIVFIALKYLLFLEIIDVEDVQKYKLLAVGLIGVYMGVNVYRIHLELILPKLGMTLDDLDNLSGELFPKERFKGKVARIFKVGIRKKIKDE